MAEAAYKDRYGPAALVTGASSGIGWAFAELLAERGFDLVLAARRTGRMEELAAKLRAAHGVDVRICTVDMAERAAPRALLDATADVDIGLVVSNAGYSIKGDYAANDADDMADMLMVNCNMPMQLAHGFIPRLRARGGGGIILTSSVEGVMGMPFSAAYSASKALVIALGEALWGEVQGQNIDIVTLCPGATESEAAARAGIDLSKLNNVMKARDVAELALDNISNGPTFFSSDHYRMQIEQMAAMPRRDALRAVAGAMKAQQS